MSQSVMKIQFQFISSQTIKRRNKRKYLYFHAQHQEKKKIEFLWMCAADADGEDHQMLKNRKNVHR